jgi:glycosyltransferase involved in cell wall biosynthesis
MAAPLKLLVEGWRGLSHSYALVNQWQLLALARRSDVDLRVRDRPYLGPTWRRQPGLFPEAQARVLDGLRPPEPGFAPDVTWRLTFPYDLSPAPVGRTLVFGTAEHRVVPPSYLADPSRLAAAIADPAVSILTPSAWSAEGFRRLGFPDERIAVVPHGVDPDLFGASPERRATIREGLRRELGFSGFVFMSVGGMNGGKGMDVLLPAFAAVSEQRPDVRLILKGSDHLYDSHRMLGAALDTLSGAAKARVAERLIYSGAALSLRQMADFYLAADAYVAPYRLEGFCLPVLEAAACGLPVICTAGGPTDEFATDAFALRIASRTLDLDVEGRPGVMLEPDRDSLVAHLLRAMDDAALRERAAVEGPRHAFDRFTWDQVVDRILPALRGDARA